MAKRVIRKTTENETINPEFIAKIEEIKKQNSIKVNDFAKRYRLNSKDQ